MAVFRDRRRQTRLLVLAIVLIVSFLHFSRKLSVSWQDSHISRPSEFEQNPARKTSRLLAEVDTMEATGKIGLQEAPSDSSSPAQALRKSIARLSQGESLAVLNENLAKLSEQLSKYGTAISSLQQKLAETSSRFKSLFLDEAQLDANSIRRKETGRFSRTVQFDELPHSTVHCTGNSTRDRICRIKWLCYEPSKDSFFIFKDTQTLELGVARNGTRAHLLDLTTIDGHNRFFFDYVDVDSSRYAGRSFYVVDRLSFIVARFHQRNIMHTIHDDFMGLYMLHRMFAPADEDDPREPFSLNNHIFFADSFMAEKYDHVHRLLTTNPLRYRAFWSRKDRPLCFQDAVVGSSKATTWYTYGFLEPQGPIANKTVSGLLVRDAAKYVMKNLGIPTWDVAAHRNVLSELYNDMALRLSLREAGERPQLKMSTDPKHYITIFSREQNRIIVNEDELALALESAYGLPVRYVKMEGMTLAQQIAVLRSTMIAMGMHGSILIMSIFLPPGALLIEFFPYAIPPENYTPYRTLCHLPGMQIIYKHWANLKEANTITYPERTPEKGGLVHLSPDEQIKISTNKAVPPHLCCKDPYWLFRIFQDTVVAIPEVLRLVDEGIVEAKELVDQPPLGIPLRPAPVRRIDCSALPNSQRPDELDLHLRWEEPWNSVVPAQYGLWCHQSYQEVITESTSVAILGCTPGKQYDFWVRPYMRDETGELKPLKYSPKYTCACTVGVAASKS